MDELQRLRKVIEILEDGQVGNQAVFEANLQRYDQSDWGRLIVKKALDIAMEEE